MFHAQCSQVLMILSLDHWLRIWTMDLSWNLIEFFLCFELCQIWRTSSQRLSCSGPSFNHRSLLWALSFSIGLSSMLLRTMWSSTIWSLLLQLVMCHAHKVSLWNHSSVWFLKKREYGIWVIVRDFLFQYFRLESLLSYTIGIRWTSKRCVCCLSTRHNAQKSRDTFGSRDWTMQMSALL